jgi:hypothetical protein
MGEEEWQDFIHCSGIPRSKSCLDLSEILAWGPVYFDESGRYYAPVSIPSNPVRV